MDGLPHDMNLAATWVYWQCWETHTLAVSPRSLLPSSSQVPISSATSTCAAAHVADPCLAMLDTAARPADPNLAIFDTAAWRACQHTAPRAYSTRLRGGHACTPHSERAMDKRACCAGKQHAPTHMWGWLQSGWGRHLQHIDAGRHTQTFDHAIIEDVCKPVYSYMYAWANGSDAIFHMTIHLCMPPTAASAA